MATIIIPNFLTEKVMTGLNTYQYTVGATAMHVAAIRVDNLPGSQLAVSIVQAGSVNATLATITLPGTLPDAVQTSASLSATANCMSGDTISFVITSSNPIDQGLNSIKALMRVNVGSSN